MGKGERGRGRRRNRRREKKQGGIKRIEKGRNGGGGSRVILWGKDIDSTSIKFFFNF